MMQTDHTTSASESLVLITSAGLDRPGIVAALTQAVVQANGNVVDAAMATLSGAFCTLLLVSVATEQLSTLTATLETVAKGLGQTVSVQPLSATRQQLQAAQRPENIWVIRVAGPDKTGITFRVSQILAQTGASIVDLSAQRLNESASGPVYLMMLEVALTNPGQQVAPLRAQLDALAQELGLEIQLEEVALTLCG